MIHLPDNASIFLALAPVNMRKSFDGLSVLVEEIIKENPLQGHLFVFRNKPSDKIKLLWWDRNGFAIFYKRLEKGRFKFPKQQGNRMVIDSEELKLLLDGIDFTRLKRLPSLSFEAVFLDAFIYSIALFPLHFGKTPLHFLHARDRASDNGLQAAASDYS